ncbi:hypothetical protein CLTEP_25910 [Clostridium tepidiprofundi DSM 19306]|uniref:Uncharacterized protein n=1 Tax=Clostridium tepidiprofundi DSM 19306 TaxID=1121338 RepID=A0A151ASD0_9CLOT|nr:hypothetical protein [Clostridium tepidiprofundi]KYH30549.1 hypothetical protein CLTEP_25910 [Clostridium tepidiprofundi DSM 19306]
MDVRMQDFDENAGDWCRKVDDNQSRLIDGSSEHLKGDLVRTIFERFNDTSRCISCRNLEK